MKHVLVAIDGSVHAWKALDQAAEYAKQTHAHLTVMHVVPVEEAPKELQEFADVENVDPGDVIFRWRKNTMLGDKLMAEAERRLSRKGIQQFTKHVVEGDATEAILTTARTHDIDAIFIGHRGLGALQSLLLGSVAHKVVQFAPCSCVIVK